MNIFFDVETTGLPKKDYHWNEHYNHFPRIVSIAWKLTGQKAKYYILNQEGHSIPKPAILIHGLTDEICNKSPHTFSDIFDEFIDDAIEANHVVGHNLYFDTSVFKANVLRVFGDGQELADAIQALDKNKRICIMRKPAKYFKGWMTLEKQYLGLFGESFKAHHALADVEATERVYNELKRLMVL